MSPSLPFPAVFHITENWAVNCVDNRSAHMRIENKENRCCFWLDHIILNRLNYPSKYKCLLSVYMCIYVLPALVSIWVCVHVCACVYAACACMCLCIYCSGIRTVMRFRFQNLKISADASSTSGFKSQLWHDIIFSFWITVVRNGSKRTDFHGRHCFLPRYYGWKYTGY